jgi:hypothetical protein
MTLSMTAARAFLLAGIALLLALSCDAQTAAKETPAARAVKMFNVFCLSQLPDLDGVAKAAGFGEFAQITGKELAQYHPAAPADEIYAWSFHDHGAKLVLTATRSAPDARFKLAAPRFANATSYACSLRIPAEENPKEDVLRELSSLLGGAPGETRDEGKFKVHSWTRETDRNLSVVHYYAPPPDQGLQALLSGGVYVRK